MCWAGLGTPFLACMPGGIVAGAVGLRRRDVAAYAAFARNFGRVARLAIRRDCQA